MKKEKKEVKKRGESKKKNARKPHLLISID
jgi:hypothetical protein